MEPRSIRREPPHSVIVEVKITDLESGIQIKVDTNDLTLYGCSVSIATPFPAGTKVMLKIAYRRKRITAFGKVIHSRPDIGMGIVFTTVEPEDQKLLEDWIAELAIPK